MKTIAAVLETQGIPLQIWELEIPSLQPGQVLIDVLYSGICQSQINEWSGRKGPDRYLPHTLGHEGCGKVVDIGTGVNKVNPGDDVVLTWIKGSGIDIPSCRYQRNGITVNSGAVSTFMTRTVVSENRLVKITGFPMKFAPLLGCAIPTGCGMVMNELQASPGKSIVIWGIGGVGMCAVIAAKISECDPIIAVDIHREKLSLAGRCGASHLVDGNSDPLAAIREITNGVGCDFAIESAGLVSTMESGFRSVKKSGGQFLIAGNVGHDDTIQINPFDLIAGKKILGSWGGASNPDRDIPKFVEMYQTGKLPLDLLISHEMSLSDINQAFDLMIAGKASRIILKIASTPS